MLKTKRSRPTPRDLYWEKKRREEEESAALLPPGLINHGNTCFMNSTLQGLIATQCLRDLVHFRTPSPGTCIDARRSPQLTNGHGLGGEYEHPWVAGMPLGDVFIGILTNAWGLQEDRKRAAMSPRNLLMSIGKKYEQYLDFRQQDAHEFLRHMLDAMRMEEQDIIKQRQPPPPKPKHNTKRLSHASPAINAEDTLESFVDMIFGGQLASVLVCDKCKKVSLTHEDFNDLSLSIKPEDYFKRHKRHRLRTFAQKLRFKTPGSHEAGTPVEPSTPCDLGTPYEWATAHEDGVPPRSSSVPTSRTEADDPDRDGASGSVRRRSFDHAGGMGAEEERGRKPRVAALDETLMRTVSPVNVGTDARTEGNAAIEDDSLSTVSSLQTRVAFSVAAGTENEPEVSEEEVSRPKKGKDDAWTKLGRRISVGMGMSKKRSSRSRSHTSKDGMFRMDSASSSSVNVSTPVQRREQSAEAAHPSSLHLHGSRPHPASPLVPQPASPSPSATSNAKDMPSRRSKALRDKSAYFQRILSDVHSANTNPFAKLHQALGGNSQAASASAQALWAKLGHFSGIEECLRMFTSVEVMDGDNMVGCHRCWKIANGTYKPRRRSLNLEDTDSESGEGERPSVDVEVQHSTHDTASCSDFSGRISPASTSRITPSITSADVLLDTVSVSSAPASVGDSPAIQPVENPPPVPGTDLTSPVPTEIPIALNTYGGLPIPVISTTGPDSPISPHPSTPPSNTPPKPLPQHPYTESPSRDSLLTPKIVRPPRSRPSESGAEDSDSSDDSYVDTSDASATTSVNSTSASPFVSPSASPRTSVDDVRPAPVVVPVAFQISQSSTSSTKVPRSQQVILRRTYKRYLIATPPPVLVIHLKRFQQTSPRFAVSFSGGFKKLDDFVAFPEYLDVAPFLAPKREDFGLAKSKKSKAYGRSKDGEQCMYRLYAVVVHIGSMLGGHYIAYTALPPSPSPETKSDAVQNEGGRSTPSLKEHDTSDDTSKTSRPPRQWACISDTNVRLATISEVLKTKAYICMYERI